MENANNANNANANNANNDNANNNTALQDPAVHIIDFSLHAMPKIFAGKASSNG